MKILAIADRPPTKSILETIRQNDVDLICTLGDLFYFDLIELERIHHIPKIGVYGNHDSGNYFEPLGIINLHLNVFEYKGFRFGGFEGCVRYKDTPNTIMYTQDEAEKMLEGFPCVDVLITHAPPYGINDEPEDLAHQGFKALKTYVDRCKPKYLLHGHTYPQNPVKQLSQTQIIYVYQDMVVELDVV